TTALSSSLLFSDLTGISIPSQHSLLLLLCARDPRGWRGLTSAKSLTPRMRSNSHAAEKSTTPRLACVLGVLIRGNDTVLGSNPASVPMHPTRFEKEKQT